MKKLLLLLFLTVNANSFTMSRNIQTAPDLKQIVVLQQDDEVLRTCFHGRPGRCFWCEKEKAFERSERLYHKILCCLTLTVCCLTGLID